MKHEFPKMLYHLTGDQVIVHTQDELTSHLSSGWAESPQEWDEASALKAKISWHKSELVRLKQMVKENK